MSVWYSLSNGNIYDIYTLCQAFMECDIQTGVNYVVSTFVFISNQKKELFHS